MALSIMNNSTAIGAMGNLNKSNSALGKTISQLSSGLRINSAADDASGLAVSEKLRGQIKGLGKAASNAQDAISLLQTAEASMGSMTDILQRMRELAVQAGDPAYTTNDRSMLQLEVDQLKSEINRISTSTEFNTKKLLNGDAAGVWSSSSANLEAIIKGSPAEGNYKIESFAAGGQNEIQKSQVMKTKEGIQVIGVADAVATPGIVSINNVRGMMASANSGTNTALSITKLTAATTTSSVSLVGKFGLESASYTGSAITTEQTGYMEFVADGVRTANGTVAMKARFVNAKTGLVGEWQSFTINSAGAVASSMTTMTFETGITLSAGTSIMGSAITTKINDRALYAVTGILAQDTTATTADIKVTTSEDPALSGGYTIRITDAVSDKGDMKHKIYTGQINSANGTVSYGSFDLTLAKGSAVTKIATPFEMTVYKEQSAASKWTTLNELSNFTNADGRNVLDKTQTLSIYGGNGKQANITIEGTDTIKDLEAKLTSALVDQLGLGSTDAIVNENLVNFVNTKTDNSNEAVKGTFVIQGATIGANSKLSFVGDENVLNGLGLSILQNYKDSETIVKVTDAHSGTVIGEDKVSDNILRGIITGVDVKVNPTGDGAIVASYNATTKKVDFKPTTAASTAAYLHLKANPTKAAIGANEGQTLDISIGRVDTVALEIDDVIVATFDDAQKSITKIDRATETLSKARATAGAQMNRLDYSINNLNTMKENLTSAESRLRDLDIAQASTDMTAQQVRLQAATAMLAQANQMPSYAAQLLK